MRLAILTFSILLASCANTTNSGVSVGAYLHPVNASKVAIQNIWYPEHDPNWQLDWTNATNNVPSQITWTYGTGGACTSTATFSLSPQLAFVNGNSTTIGYTGTISVSNSVAASTVGGMPPCSMFNGNYSVTILAGVLSITGSDNITDYFD